jgi:hypothetical protein
VAYDPNLAPLVRRTATNLGINPSDLGTAMSYETGGTFNPNMWGGKGGNYLGLIQFGPEEQQKYGVTPGMPLDQHMSAVENYLRDRGVKPGMGMLDLYSTINAGSPGRYNASDANNGGMPGTVADKVASQMSGHRTNANVLLGGDNAAQPPAPDNITPAVQQQQSAANPAPAGAGTSANTSLGSLDGGVAPPAAAPGGGLDLGKLASAVGGMKKSQQADQGPQGVPISIAQPAGLPAAKQLAQIMQSLRT